MKHTVNGRTSITARQNKKAKIARVLAPVTYESLLAEDVESAKRKIDALDEFADRPCITLGYMKHCEIKSNLLGPILKMRFLG